MFLFFTLGSQVPPFPEDICFYIMALELPPFPEDICSYIVALELSGSATLQSWKDSEFQKGLQEALETKVVFLKYSSCSAGQVPWCGWPHDDKASQNNVVLIFAFLSWKCRQIILSGCNCNFISCGSWCNKITDRIPSHVAWTHLSVNVMSSGSRPWLGRGFWCDVSHLVRMSS